MKPTSGLTPCRALRARPRTGGFTLVELLVVLAIIGLLIGLLMPALGLAQRKGAQRACSSNLHQLQMAHITYAGDNLMRLCANDTQTKWFEKLSPYVGRRASAGTAAIGRIFRCPAGEAVKKYGSQRVVATVSDGIDLITLQWGTGSIPGRLDQIDNPSSRLAFFDFTNNQRDGLGSKSQLSGAISGADRLKVLRHPSRSMNIAFLDGSVRGFPNGPNVDDIWP